MGLYEDRAAEGDYRRAKNPRYQMFLEHVIDMAEQAGWDVRTDYSGRGMFGGTCLGVIMPDTRGLADIYFHFGYKQAETERPAEYEYPRHNTDSMGLNTIMYWPDLQVETETEGR